MEARKKADDLAPRETRFVKVMIFAHRYHQLDRWDVLLYIRRFKEVVNVEAGLSQIEEALEF